MTWTPNLALHRKIAARVRLSDDGMQQADAADEASQSIDAHRLILYRDSVAVATLSWGLPPTVDGEVLRSPGSASSAVVTSADIDSGSWSARLESLNGMYVATTDSVGKANVPPGITGTPEVGETLTVSDGTIYDVLVSDDIDSDIGVSVSLTLAMDDDLSSGGLEPGPDPAELDWYSLVDATNASAMYHNANLTGQPVVNGNRVGAVLDTSGKGNHWREWDGDSTRPEYVSSGGGYIEISDNYHRGMAIDGTNRLVDVRKPWWIAMAIKLGGPINTHAVLLDKDYVSGGPGGAQLAVGIEFPQGLFCEKLIDNSSVGPTVNSSSITTSTWGIASFGYDGTNLTARVNFETKGVVSDTRSLPDEDGAMVLRIGGNTPSIVHYKAVGFLDYYPGAAEEDEAIEAVASIAGLTDLGPDPGPEPEPEPGEHHFFRADSPWNVDIKPGATWHGASHPVTAEIRKTSISGGGTVYAVNAQNYAINVFYASPGGPTQTIRVRDIYGPGGVPRYDFHVTVPWPSGTHPAQGTDGHLSIHDPDGVTCHEFWYLRLVGGTYEAATYSRTRKDGTGWRLFPDQESGMIAPHSRNPAEATAGSGACRAVSVGLLGGLITKEDVDAGVINHALALALPRAMIKRGPRVPPADAISSNYDGDSSSVGPIAYSMRFALPPSVNIGSLGMSDEWEMVADAFQRKGGYPVDVGGNGGREVMIYTQYPGAFAFGTALRSRQSTDFPKIVSRLEYVPWSP